MCVQRIRLKIKFETGKGQGIMLACAQWCLLKDHSNPARNGEGVK